jgi:hypothetical protein
MSLDFGTAVSIISRYGLRFGCLLSGRSNPGPILLEFAFEPWTSAKEVIMTSTREYYGSQDFFALDIPIT